MSRDPLNTIPSLADKLARLQGQCAAGTKPGSHPHPRRVLKEGAKFIQESSYEEEPKPRNAKRSKPKDKVSTKRRQVAKASSGGSNGHGGRGETDTERTIHPGQEEEMNGFMAELDELLR